MAEEELPAHLRAWLATRHVRTWLAMRHPSMRAWLKREGPRLAAEAQRLREALARGESPASLDTTRSPRAGPTAGGSSPNATQAQRPGATLMPALPTEE